MNKLAIPIGILVVVAAVIAALAWRSSYVPDRSASQMEPTPRQQTFQEMMLVGTDAVYVDDQPSGAMEVLVGFAVMKDAGFVVVHADDDGVPGAAIGTSALLPAGGGEHVTVTLQEALEDGEIYYAVLYRDDGDGGFDATEDRQVTDASNNVILMTFAASTDAEPEFGPISP